MSTIPVLVHISTLRSFNFFAAPGLPLAGLLGLLPASAGLLHAGAALGATDGAAILGSRAVGAAALLAAPRREKESCLACWRARLTIALMMLPVLPSRGEWQLCSISHAVSMEPVLKRIGAPDSLGGLGTDPLFGELWSPSSSTAASSRASQRNCIHTSTRARAVKASATRSANQSRHQSKPGLASFANIATRACTRVASRKKDDSSLPGAAT